jgi:hypothetical protein
VGLIARFAGLVLLALALMLGVTGGMEELGALIFRLDPPLLNTLQAGVQRRLAPWLWDSVLLPVLLQPAWLAPLLLALPLLWLGRPRRG